ncbi:CPBP family intramembrane glutamic endopeptidase [Kitasatospora aureofaciens]|uniref:CPBP family intramembrane glutamic endopeptidase n=1 Tax=Kitasatospora aureofaciens TaxID=1894 RepID=UPI001C458784|nr:CPBP family intramembrane glutamic endopeptidase [Kitasatospora aureofaciens]MBV6703115.1 CPBP family intramembrane metalloprotease [Kitasatospora aureofaciens]
MRAYLLAVLVLWGLAPMALASHLHGRWIETKFRNLPTLPVYLVLMTGLVGLALAVLGPRMLWDGRWPGLATAAPGGIVLTEITWRADRYLLRKLGRRPGRPAPNTAQVVRQTRPVGIAARGPRPATAAQRTMPTNRWGKAERQREIYVGLPWLVAGAVLEELWYRGALGHLALSGIPLPVGVLLLAGTTAAFALSHLPFGWRQTAAKLPLSVLAITATLTTGTVLTAVIGHTLFNVRVWHLYQRTTAARAKAATG